MERTPISWEALGNICFQASLEQYLTQRLDFRSCLMRFRNPLAYSGWRKLLTKAIMLGNNQNLYQQGPINAIMGGSYLGEKEIERQAKRLRQVQNSLRPHGIELLFVIAPGKPYILPQFWAGSCRPRTAHYQLHICPHAAQE
jgi:hypothetical protein